MLQSDCCPQYNDILIAKDGSYLKHVFTWKNQGENLAILSSIAILRPNLDKISPHFFSQILKQPSTKAMMQCYVSGAAIPRIILKDFKKMKILVPTKDLIEQYETLANSLFDQIYNLSNSNSSLEKIKTTLSNRLMSGNLNTDNLDVEFPPSMREQNG